MRLQFRAGRSHPVAAFHSRRERSCEFTALDLSAGTFRDLPHNSDQARDFKAGEPLAGKVSELLSADLGMRTQYDGGGDVRAKSAMRDRENSGFDHIWVVQKGLFNFGRRDLLPSAVDDILYSADNEEISLRVHVA